MEGPGTPAPIQLDLLFVIDSSSGMRRAQHHLACAIPAFVEALSGTAGGLPDLQVAVISSDLGSGAISAPGCDRPRGDDGAFRAAAVPAIIDCSEHGGEQLDTTGCRGPSAESFLRHASSLDNNLGGQTLGQALACLLPLGEDGCRFQGPLAATGRALERAAEPQDDNHGFLRPGAYLAVLLLTQEDDCSMPADALLADVSGGTGATSELGPLTTFRCVEAGLDCLGEPPARIPGPLSGCRPADERARSTPRSSLSAVSDLARDVRTRAASGRLLVEAIAGPVRADRAIEVRWTEGSGSREAELVPACVAASGAAAPAIRIQSFLDALGSDGAGVTSACSGSYADVLRSFARRIAARSGRLLHATSERPGIVAKGTR